MTRPGLSGRNRSFVKSFYEAMGGDVVATASGDDMMRMGEVLSGAVTDDFECVMITRFGSQSYPGVAGFREAWRDWLEPYSSFSAETEDLVERGDVVLLLVRQRGTTKRDGVEIENASASVWRFREGKLARVEFYLDRAAGIEAAGI
jgi:ketosteroid isomerase-like protein